MGIGLYRGTIYRDGTRRLRVASPAEFLAEIQQRVELRFDVDPAKLAMTNLPENGPPFVVMRLKNGAVYHWEKSEPNRKIWKYLHGSSP